ncbi:hypothetical protein MBOU_56040 [Mycobacterium bourgelatii]|uniref:Uncharacterized protein n=1 Tax=Mycobacterium bourgelatii TaxID=1273442 RepID=A0A7I9YYC1_MYCBU|nr:hypothetical protein MBOU_56040 [Mycobacterium bourgelatii]
MRAVAAVTDQPGVATRATDTAVAGRRPGAAIASVAAVTEQPGLATGAAGTPDGHPVRATRAARAPGAARAN